MFLEYCLMILGALGFGLLSSGGVFTVFVSVGLVPRFADKTHTADHIIKYENAIVAGSVLGCIFSIYHEVFIPFFSALGRTQLVGNGPLMAEGIFGQGLCWGDLILGVFGLFAGMFVGCFAIAIAEMLNTIPISVRRIGLGRGAGIVLLAIALGKTAGSLIYYLAGF
ncbi:MAG: stage V sporulation protein AB [Lachnospiraceae bacterium]|nr:stage V sporulation protein AB [Lachnospiraceae bacterium]